MKKIGGMKAKLFWIAVGIALCSPLIYGALFPDHSSSAKSSSGEALIGGDFTLTDHRGNRVNESDFRGKLMLVYFGFANCPAVCPTDLSIMARVMEGLNDSRDEVAAIFITVDPERDTVESLSSYMENFHPDMIALTGAAEETKAAQQAYKIFAKKVEDPMMEGYMMEHSAFMYLMDREGHYIKHFAHNENPVAIIKSILQQL